MSEQEKKELRDALQLAATNQERCGVILRQNGKFYHTGVVDPGADIEQTIANIEATIAGRDGFTIEIAR